MTIHFASVDGRPAFFDSAIHGDRIPADAVEITPARHAELLDAQAAGKEIYAGKKGRPRYRRPIIDADRQRADLIQTVRREARRRIEAVSPIWRQLNDHRTPTSAGEARFAAIDAIRAASEEIEKVIAATASGDLAELDILACPEWGGRDSAEQN